jgi:serine/threonine protein kinase
VIHRDLKPDNIVLDSKASPVILDFGLCYLEDDEKRLTTTMEQVGSRFYMAPELESGRFDHLSATVDSYALGKILYFLLTGKHMIRENYSGEDSLTAICQDKQLDYVTQRILAKSVIQSPHERVLPEQLSSEARQIVRLITQHFYPGWEGTLCRFCGEGVYKRMPRSTLRVRQPGIEHSVTFAPLVCSNCGNIQWFTERKS